MALKCTVEIVKSQTSAFTGVARVRNYGMLKSKLFSGFNTTNPIPFSVIKRQEHVQLQMLPV